MRHGTLVIILYPFDKTVASLRILLNPHSLKDCLKGFLSVARDDELFVLHQFYYVVENLKVLEALT